MSATGGSIRSVNPPLSPDARQEAVLAHGDGALLVTGAAGTGKSSVVRAGLMPALAGGVLPGSETWERVLILPGEHPLDELEQAVDGIQGDPKVALVDNPSLTPSRNLMVNLTIEQYHGDKKKLDAAMHYLTWFVPPTYALMAKPAAWSEESFVPLG